MILTTKCDFDLVSQQNQSTMAWSLVVKHGKDEIFFWGSDIVGTEAQIKDLHQHLREGIVRSAAKYGQEILFKTTNPELAKVVEVVMSGMSVGVPE